MDLQQTWAQVLALPLVDQQAIFENLLVSLHGGVIEPEIDEELIAELDARMAAHEADPSQACSLEELHGKIWATKK